MDIKSFLSISPEIQEAIKNNKPIVALESTIISHGMPYPQNLETAQKVEEIIRENGAVPATIAIIKGQLKIGLSSEELKYLAKKGLGVIKCSRRDIPFIVTNSLDGATTVAGTMIIAALGGIKVFATGGIGGVHRGAENTMDISADLEELANTNVAVVCAGCKSILDIGLTKEYLETKGVPIIGVRTNDLPAFYTRKSGFNVDYKIDTEKEIAKVLNTKWKLGLDGGAIIANPIPEKYSMDEKVINKAIEGAIYEAEARRIKGKETTPFLLAKVKDITSGQSLESNIQLVYNNAKVAAKISVELSKL